MGFTIGGGILNTIKPQLSNKDLWVHIAGMRNTAVIVDKESKKIKTILTQDQSIRNAIDTLKKVKSAIVSHGATESLFCIFNEGGKLADAINMCIPLVTADNADAIGTACCENIDATVEDAYSKLKNFFSNITIAIDRFFEKLKLKVMSQTETLNVLLHKKLANCTTNNVEPTGYSYPLYMSKLAALDFITNNIATVECTKEAIEMFTPHLKVLGYSPVIKSFENMNDPEVELTEAPEEAPVQEPLTPKPEGDPDEVISTEEPSLVATPWTIDNIKLAIASTCQTISTTDKMFPISAKLATIRDTALGAITEIEAGADATEKETIISKCRNLAAFMVDVTVTYNNAMNDLVDQIVNIAGSVIESKEEPVPAPAPVATPAPAEPEVPTEDPAPVPAEPAQSANIVKPWYENVLEDEEPLAEPALEPQPETAPPAPAEPEPVPPIEEPNTTPTPEPTPNEPEVDNPETLENALGVKLF